MEKFSREHDEKDKETYEGEVAKQQMQEKRIGVDRHGTKNDK